MKETTPADQLPEVTPEQLEQQLETTIESARQQLTPALITALDVLADGAMDPEDRMIFRALAKRLPILMEVAITPTLDQMKENLRSTLSVIVRVPEPHVVEAPKVQPEQLAGDDPLALEERACMDEADALAAIQTERTLRNNRAATAKQRLNEARAHHDGVYAAALRGLRTRKDLKVADEDRWKALCEDAQASDEFQAYESQTSNWSSRMARLNARREALAQQQARRAFCEFVTRRYFPAAYALREAELERQALVTAAMQRWPNTQRVEGYHLPIAAGLPFKCGIPDGVFTSSTTNGRTIFDQIRKIFGEYDINLLSADDPIRDEIIRVRQMEVDAQRQAQINAGPLTVEQMADRRRLGL
jgi:hypothetical protein